MAAQDAELKLKVSLDLAFFRAQLSRLPIEAAGYSVPINIKLDNRSIASEFRRLNAYFGRKEYNLQVNDTAIKTARTNAQKLKNTLDLLNRTKVTIDLGTKRTGASLEDLESLFSKGKTGQAFGGGAVQQARQNVARQGLISRLEKRSSFAGGYNVPGLKRVIEELGGKPAGGKRDDLVAQAKKLAQEADDALINRVWSSVKDLQMNMRYAGGGGYGVGQSISRMINSMSLASSNPYAARQQLRSLPPEYITTELAGRASEQAMANQALGQTGAPVSAKFQNSFDKYLEAVVGQAMADASIARQRYMQRTSPLQQLTPTVPPRSYFQYTGTPLLPPSKPKSGFAAWSQAMTAQYGGGGGAGGGGGGKGGGGNFPVDGMINGKQGPTRFIGAGSSMEKFKTSIAIAEQSMAKFRASSLPFIGGLREIGFEFATATKQVLLYGTAYRGLAFLTSLPGQFLNAAKSQQQFNNALQTATQDTGTFAKELLYVDSVQRAFGLNLETTRSGFVRLYASMAPTGFDSGSIEKLFTGISAATAALQLTPDKAERVIYAFGQMASKGQIMSEELKGQLGDVLPGALALFAKAAGMSVKEFSKAMEDGEFVGQRFREVFAKVSDELMNRFGTGAQAAAKSLQGLLNTVQGDFQRTLESFAPLANIAAQAILLPLSGALRQLSTSAQIAMGEQNRLQKQLESAQQDLGDLQIGGAKPEQIQAAAQNVAALQARLQALNEAAKDPAVAKQAKDLQVFTGEVVKAATVVMNIAKTIGSVLTPVITFLGTNLSTVVAVVTGFGIALGSIRLIATATMAALTLMNIVIKGTTGQALGVNALSVAFRALGINASTAQIGVIGLGNAFKVLMFSSGIGIAVGLFSAIAGAALSMGDAMRQAGEQAKQTMKDMAQAAIQGNVALVQMQASVFNANIAALRTTKQQLLKTGGAVKATGRASASTVYKTNPVQRQILAQLGVEVPEGGLTASQLDKAFNDAMYVQKTGLAAAQQYEAIARQNQSKIGFNQPTPQAAAAAGTEEAGGAAGGKRESQVPELKVQLEYQKALLAIEGQISNARLGGNELLVTRLEGEKELLDLLYEAKKVQVDNIPAKEKQLKLEAISVRAEISRMQTRAKMEMEITKAIQEQQNNVKEMADKSALELKNKQMYAELLLNGVKPAHAQILIEVDNEINKIKEKLLLTREQIKAEINLLKAKKAAKKPIDEKTLSGLEAKYRETEQAIGALPGIATDETAKRLLATAPKSQAVLLKEEYDKVTEEFEKMISLSEMVKNSAQGIGEAFGNSFKEIANGSMTAQEALASFFQNVGDYFLDMAARMIAKWTEMQIIGLATSLLSGMSGSGGGGGGGNIFGGGAQGLSTTIGFGSAINGFAGANGGIAKGGFVSFKPFADGGTVTGPTLGLVGEGRYNEAIVPLPNGKSIPVDLGGAAGNQIVSNITVNVNNGQAQTEGAGGGADLSRKLEGAVKQVIIGEMRPGGVLAGRR